VTNRQPEPEIFITPSGAQCRRLVENLEALRATGSESNTAAILEAVEALAAQRRDKVARSRKKAERRANAPGPASGG
jgi:hypothetical protein